MNKGALITFAPSLKVAQAIISGSSSEKSPGKDFARTQIGCGRVLSVPVVGGSAQLKRKDVDLSDISISDHGVWRREHLGAWNAVYGKAPFFPYIFPSIEDAYERNSHGSLADFNNAIWKIAYDFVEWDRVATVLMLMRENNPERMEQLRADLATKVNLNYSIFDAIFRLGKNIVFLL